jgi:hypothetical protein
MSTTVFPFRFTTQPKACEYPTFHTRITAGNEGSDQRAADYGADFKLVAIGSIRLPQSSTGKTLADWLAFVEGLLGQYDSCLYKPFTERYFKVTAEALGSSGTVFPLLSKYIDASTLVVKKAGVTLTLTTDYTFSGNNTAPTVTLLVAAGGNAITANYERYFPMFLTSDGNEPVLASSKSTDATRNVRIDNVELEETLPGAHLV